MIQLIQKLVKDTLDTVIFTIDFTDTLDDDVTLTGILSSQRTDNTISLNDVAVNDTEITTNDDDVIAVGKAILLNLSDGVLNREYKISLILNLSDGDEIEIEIAVFVNKTGVEYYGSAYRSNDYIALYNAFTPVGSKWALASIDDKVKALIAATRAIDRLNFAGDLASTTQTLQFPRGTDTDVPIDIERACYEEAAHLLAGAISQVELSNLSVTSQGISSVRTTYDRAVVPNSVRAGIVSHAAWAYLAPYLRDPREILLSRV